MSGNFVFSESCFIINYFKQNAFWSGQSFIINKALAFQKKHKTYVKGYLVPS